MEVARFKKFIMLIDGVHKCIGKIKFDIAPSLGVKSVHLLWCYELYTHPEGLTSAELAAASMIDRSLVSRELSVLKKSGYVEVGSEGKKRGYNARIVLTDKGVELAKKIEERAEDFRMIVNSGTTEEEIAAFYETLEKFHTNLCKLNKGDPASASEDGKVIY